MPGSRSTETAARVRPTFGGVIGFKVPASPLQVAVNSCDAEPMCLIIVLQLRQSFCPFPFATDACAICCAL